MSNCILKTGVSLLGEFPVLVFDLPEKHKIPGPFCFSVALRSDLNEPELARTREVFGEHTDGLLALAKKDEKVVIIDRWFLSQMTREEQLAIIGHEIGHIVLGHVDKIVEKDDSDNIEFEYEADAYASGLVSKEAMATALEKTIELYKSVAPPEAFQTVKLRVDLLRR